MKKYNFNSRPPVLSKEGTQEVLSDHHENIEGCIRDAKASWVRFGENAPEDRKPLNSTAQATYFYCHIVDSAKRRFHGNERIILSEQTGFLVVSFDGKINLRFKKFDRQFRSGSIPTTQYVEWMSQICIEGHDKTNVVCGYCLDVTQSEIAGIYIACPIGTRNEWVYPIGDSATAIVKPEITLPLDVSPRVATVVRPAITKREKKEEKKLEVG